MFRVIQEENLKKEDNAWQIFVGAFITMIGNCRLNICLSSEIVQATRIYKNHKTFE